MMKRLIIISLVLFFFFNILSAQAQNQVDPDGFNRFYYPNGQVSSEGYLRNGQPDGYWKTYFENGSLKSEGNRIDFLLDSTWTFYDENGNKTLEVNYKAGMKEGKRFTYRENETIEENFSNDIKQGQTIYYYLDNRIFRIINFENGLEEGMAKEYADDGRVILITTYRKGFLISRERINRLDSEGRKQGYWKFFHKNGLVKLEGFYLNDLKNGFFKEYDSTGKLVEATKWLKGEIQEQAEELTKLEVSKEYYPDGKIAVFQTFKNGIPHGVKRDYSKEGTIVSGSLYKEGKLIASGITREDGVRNGAWKDYYSDGKLKAEGNYKDGKMIGKWNFYHVNGKIEQIGEFDKQGRPVGKWLWYYPSGNLLREEHYIGGKADGMMSEYSETGDLIAEGDYIDGEEEGQWKYNIGNFKEEGRYSYGLRHGLWKHYYNDGTLMFQGEFINGKPHGKHTVFWDNEKIKDETTYEMGIKQGNSYSYNYSGELILVITYQDGAEVSYDGIKVDPLILGEDE